MESYESRKETGGVPGDVKKARRLLEPGEGRGFWDESSACWGGTGVAEEDKCPKDQRSQRHKGTRTGKEHLDFIIALMAWKIHDGGIE